MTLPSLGFAGSRLGAADGLYPMPASTPTPSIWTDPEVWKAVSSSTALIGQAASQAIQSKAQAYQPTAPGYTPPPAPTTASGVSAQALSFIGAGAVFIVGAVLLLALTGSKKKPRSTFAV